MRDLISTNRFVISHFSQDWVWVKSLLQSANEHTFKMFMRNAIIATGLGGVRKPFFTSAASARTGPTATEYSTLRWPPPSISPCRSASTATSDESNRGGAANYRHKVSRRDLRFIFPEFLPDPVERTRNRTVERLVRKDMLRRRNAVEIPEFYVGSVVAVTVSDKNAPSANKTSRFVGIVIARGGAGLNAWFTVRNVIDGQGIEFMYNMYAPTIQKIETLRLEKRIDDELFYLRDAPQEYSTFPEDMEMEILPEGTPTPINDIVVPLNPKPWHRRWENMRMTGRLKGFTYDEADANQKRKWQVKNEKFMQYMHPGWHFEVAKYDLLLQYLETISVEEQDQIWREVGDELEKRDKAMRKVAAKRAFVKPEKNT